MTSANIPPPPAAPPPAQSEVNDGVSTAPPRKRRRRTAAGGANDDCFTCRSRAISCDRKRPYCTQCIEIGKECSGYKTTLTWGVGVASRGKLRGLSCPVANKNVDGSDVLPEEMESRKRRKSSVSSKVRLGSDVTEGSTSNVSIGVSNSTPTSAPSSSSMPPTSAVQAQSYPPRNLTLSIPQFSTWQNTSYFDQRGTENPRHTHQLHRPMQLQTSLGPHFNGPNVPPHSARSLTSYADTEFYSPLEYPHTPSIVTPYTEQVPSHSSSHPHPDAMSTSPRDTFHTPTIGSYGSNVTTGMDSVTSNAPFEPVADFDGFNDVLYNGDESMFAPFDETQLAMSPLHDSALQVGEVKYETDRKDVSLLDSRFGMPFFHLTSRMQTLLNYYDKHICPHLVAYDGPENPYRTHVLQLATHNDGLQNAIAALSMNNLRMRRKGRQESGFVEDLTSAFDGGDAKDFNEPTAEESCYKQMSIDKLNMQLTDAGAAQDDSVLATLLILCLFHVCDSGFSKFKTQLAGVQKLLSLRKAHVVPSTLVRCVELFFTWFDVLTSTVNDRETQISRESLALLDLSVLEQYSGCNGRLFKLIARLGRLNLLAQCRAVHNPPPPDHFQPQSAGISPAHVQRVVRAMRKKERTAKLLHAGQLLSPEYYDNVDGNGWGSPLISCSSDDDEESADFAAIAADPHSSFLLDDFASDPPDDRSEFWREWRHVRARLRTWQPDTLPSPPTSSSSPSTTAAIPPEVEIHHINEAFRHSALLYTLRLGYPVMPSSWPPIATLVTTILTHISAIPPFTHGMSKFTLWPLFVSGTECTIPSQREIIRSRCRALQKDSGFFNNLSSLDVLEKVWREADEFLLPNSSSSGSASSSSTSSSATAATAHAPTQMQVMRAVEGGFGTEEMMPSEQAETEARMRDSQSGKDARGIQYCGLAFRWRRAMDRVDGEYIVI